MNLHFMLHEFHARTISRGFMFGNSLQIIYLILRSEECSLSSSNNSFSATPLDFLLIYYQYSNSQKPSTARIQCSWVSPAKKPAINYTRPPKSSLHTHTSTLAPASLALLDTTALISSLSTSIFPSPSTNILNTPLSLL